MQELATLWVVLIPFQSWDTSFGHNLDGGLEVLKLTQYGNGLFKGDVRMHPGQCKHPRQARSYDV